MATSAGELIYTVDVDTGRAISETKKAEKAVENLQGKMNSAAGSSEKLSSSLSKVAGAVAAAITVERIAAAMNAAIQASKVFQKSMSDLSAITGATGEQLKLLEANARQIGATTSLSASQAAEAFKLIASAKPDLLESSAALNTVTRAAVTLAEAAGTTLPEAADTLGSALNQFGADASEANRYINVLAAGSKFGAAEVTDVAAALKNSGVAAASAGVGFETLNAAIQSLAAVGIKRGEAGTGLRNIILKLETDTNQKLRPSVVGLTSALQTLASANESTAALTKRFGLENITAAQALLNNAESMAELERKLTGTNTAYEQASTRVNNLDGDMKALNSATEALAIAIGDKLNPAARDSAKFMTELATATTNWLDSLSESPSTLNGAIFKLQAVYEEIKRLEQVQSGQGAAGFWGGILGVDVTKRLDEQRSKARQLQDFIAGLQGRPSGGDGSGSGSKPTQPPKEDPKTENEALERLRQQAELARLSGAARARLAAIQRLGKDATKEEKDEAERLATEIFNLDEQQRKLKKSTGSSTSEAERNASAIADAKLKTEQLRLELANLKAGTDEASSSTSRYSIESARLAAQQQLNKQASKEQVEALAQEILSQKKLEEQIRKQQKAAKTKRKVNDDFEGIKRSVIKTEDVDAKYKEDLAKLDAYYQQAGKLDESYQATKSALERQYREARQAAVIEDFKAQSEANEFLMNSIDAFGQASTNAISGLLSGTMSATEAIQNFANVIMDQAIGALVEIGLQYVKNQVVASSAFAAEQAMNATKGAAMTAAVTAQVGMQTALAAQAAFAATAAIPIVGPALAPAAAGAAAATAQALGTPAIAMAPLAGAREFGGPVDAGKMYRVGEGGAPEIFQSGGKNFMIPGDGGKVIPNDQIGGGGFSQNVQVHNYSGENVQTKTSMDGKQLDVIIGEVAKQISQRRGGVGRALSSSTGLKWKAQ